MKREYKCLPKQEFIDEDYKLTAIRDQDKYEIMKWRNEQIVVLRQKEVLTKKTQNGYFKNVVDKLFEQEKPSQLLFSFFKNDVLIGYGGLVHIDWESRNAEISFLTATARNKSREVFSEDWSGYLNIILRIAFGRLKFLKIHTTFYDIEQRKTYKEVLLRFNFIQEAILKKHILVDGKVKSILIYSCFNKK